MFYLEPLLLNAKQETLTRESVTYLLAKSEVNQNAQKRVCEVSWSQVWPLMRRERIDPRITLEELNQAQHELYYALLMLL